ncbi:MAG: T9SS type A sorting domain-containing protein [Saprospiraceae bacterium]
MTTITLHSLNNFKSYYQKLQQIGILLLGIAFVTPTFAQTFVQQTGSDNLFQGVNVGFLSSIAFVDIDNDGDFDAFIGKNNGKINYYKNTGTNVAPIFTKKTGSDNPLDNVNLLALSAPTFVDIDNDGDFDAFIGESDGTVNYYKNTGSNTNPNFGLRTGSNNPFNGVDVGLNASPVFVDLDNDGDFDAFLGRNNGKINYYKNTGTNTNAILTEQTGSDNPLDGIDIGDQSAPTIIDIDQDGDFDVFVGEFLGNMNYYKNTGTNTNPNFVVKTGSDNPLDGIDVGFRSTPAFVDINNDGHIDLFSGEENGTIQYYLNTTGLPVELTYFKGQVIAEGNLLTWQTASEENNDGFEVQRSADGNEWETIDFVIGNGTTLDVQNYEYIDMNVLGRDVLVKRLYRLKQIDFDGQFEYSKIVSIENNTAKVEVSDFYPNPSSSGLVNLDFTASNDDDVTISVFDMTGKLMINQVRQVTEGSNLLNFDFSTLNKGIYFIKIGNENNTIMRKLIIE